jgi:hypothetical protein
MRIERRRRRRSRRARPPARRRAAERHRAHPPRRLLCGRRRHAVGIVLLSDGTAVTAGLARELKALVESIVTRIDGLMTITLDNGQVWQQTRPDSPFRLKAGDTVKIQPGALRSYLMTGPTNRSTRVTRVK